MRYAPVFIFAYLILGLQVGLAPYIHFHNANPNLVLIFAIFIAMSAPRQPALLVCYGLGLLQDMLSVQSLGLYALSYSIVALFVIALRDVVVKEHPLTHITLTLVSGLLVSSILLTHGLLRLEPSHRLSTSALISASIYTAILSPFLLVPLNHFRRLFAFAPTRRQMRTY